MDGTENPGRRGRQQKQEKRLKEICAELSGSEQLHQITALKQAGFTLEDIRKLQSGVDAKTFLSRKRTEILAKIAELTGQLAVLDGYMEGSGSSLEAPVLIRTIFPFLCGSSQIHRRKRI